MFSETGKRKERHVSRARVCSLLTALCFTLVNHAPPPLQAQAPAAHGTAPFELFNDITAIPVPAEIGEVQEFYRGGGKLVILIQDAHSIPEAQNSIRALLNFFQTRYGISLTLLEGTSSALDARIFRSFPDRKLLEKTFKEYMAAGELTGGAAAAIFNRSETVFTGLENWELYEEEIEYYLKAAEAQSGVLEKIEAYASELDREKRETYSERLYEVDRETAAFRRNELDLIDLLRKLETVKAPEKGSKLEDLLRGVSGEGETGALEAEVKSVAKMVKRVLQSTPGRADAQADLQTFNREYQKFQTSQSSAQAFGLVLKNIITRQRIPVQVSARLREKVRREKKMQDIKGTQLFRELESYIREVKKGLFRNGEEVRLDQESRRVERLERLAKLELSQEEWTAVERMMSLRGGNTVYQDGIAGAEDIGAVLEKLQNHIRFYETARRRDRVFTTRTLAEMKEHGRNQALIVAGGFHTEGLTRNLKAEGISYVLVTPRIEELPEENKYRDHMRGDVSWKEYFKVEGGRVSLYEAFVRGVRDSLLERSEMEKGVLLKNWRDQIIRDLADRGEIEKAPRYLRFIDEAVSGEAPSVPSLQEKWFRHIDGFMDKIEALQKEGRLDERNVMKLMGESMAAVLAHASSLSPGDTARASLLRAVLKSSASLPERTARPEMRNAEASEIGALLGGKLGLMAAEILVNTIDSAFDPKSEFAKRLALRPEIDLRQFEGPGELRLLLKEKLEALQARGPAGLLALYHQLNDAKESLPAQERALLALLNHVFPDAARARQPELTKVDLFETHLEVFAHGIKENVFDLLVISEGLKARDLQVRIDSCKVCPHSTGIVTNLAREFAQDLSGAEVQVMQAVVGPDPYAAGAAKHLWTEIEAGDGSRFYISLVDSQFPEFGFEKDAAGFDKGRVNVFRFHSDEERSRILAGRGVVLSDIRADNDYFRQNFPGLIPLHQTLAQLVRTKTRDDEGSVMSGAGSFYYTAQLYFRLSMALNYTKSGRPEDQITGAFQQLENAVAYYNKHKDAGNLNIETDKIYPVIWLITAKQQGIDLKEFDSTLVTRRRVENLWNRIRPGGVPSSLEGALRMLDNIERRVEAFTESVLETLSRSETLIARYAESDENLPALLEFIGTDAERLALAYYSFLIVELPQEKIDRLADALPEALNAEALKSQTIQNSGPENRSELRQAQKTTLENSNGSSREDILASVAANGQGLAIALFELGRDAEESPLETAYSAEAEESHKEKVKQRIEREYEGKISGEQMARAIDIVEGSSLFAARSRVTGRKTVVVSLSAKDSALLPRGGLGASLFGVMLIPPERFEDYGTARLRSLEEHETSHKDFDLEANYISELERKYASELYAQLSHRIYDAASQEALAGNKDALKLDMIARIDKQFTRQYEPFYGYLEAGAKQALTRALAASVELLMRSLGPAGENQAAVLGELRRKFVSAESLEGLAQELENALFDEELPAVNESVSYLETLEHRKEAKRGELSLTPEDLIWLILNQLARQEAEAIARAVIQKDFFSVDAAALGKYDSETGAFSADAELIRAYYEEISRKAFLPIPEKNFTIAFEKLGKEAALGNFGAVAEQLLETQNLFSAEIARFKSLGESLASARPKSFWRRLLDFFLSLFGLGPKETPVSEAAPRPGRGEPEIPAPGQESAASDALPELPVREETAGKDETAGENRSELRKPADAAADLTPEEAFGFAKALVPAEDLAAVKGFVTLENSRVPGRDEVAKWAVEQARQQKLEAAREKLKKAVTAAFLASRTENPALIRTAAALEVYTKEAQALLATLSELGDRRYTLGVALPGSAAKGKFPLFDQLLSVMKREGSVSEIALNGNLTSALQGQFHEMGVNLRPVNFRRSIIPYNDQPAIPLIILANLAGQIDGMFLPLRAEMENTEDPLVVDYVELLRSVAALHMADLVSQDKTLLLDAGKLKAALLSRLRFGDNSGNILTHNDSGWVIKSTVARAYLEMRVAEAVAAAA